MITATSKNPFFLLEVSVFEDKDLSLAAKGLYAYIQSQGGSIDLSQINAKDKTHKKALDELFDNDLVHTMDE